MLWRYTIKLIPCIRVNNIFSFIQLDTFEYLIQWCFHLRDNKCLVFSLSAPYVNVKASGTMVFHHFTGLSMATIKEAIIYIYIYIYIHCAFLSFKMHAVINTNHYIWLPQKLLDLWSGRYHTRKIIQYFQIGGVRWVYWYPCYWQMQQPLPRLCWW